MPVRRHIGFLLAGAAFASLALAAAAAQAQDGSAASDPAADSAPAPWGRTARSPRTALPGPSGEAGGLRQAGGLRPALAPAGLAGASPAPPNYSETGSAPRPGLRPPKTRRARPPVQTLVKGDFRATIAPSGIAADVQPVQVGVPDPAQPPSPPPRRRRAEAEDPYAPLGLRVGNVVLTPALGQSIGYDTNPNRLQTNLKPSALSLTEAELGIQSDWSRHELSGQLRGAYSEYFDNPAARRPEGAGNLRLRLDVTRDTDVEIEGHYIIDTQRPSSPDLNAPVVSRPVIYTEGGSVGVTQRFNRLIATMRGTIDRYDYENAKLADGGVINQGDRNMTQYGLRGRLGYEVHPGLVPFVETIVDTRQYDQKIDNSGYARSSDGVSVRAGTLVELSRLLTAEIAAGAVVRHYEDPRLRTLNAPVADATLTYAMTPLTTIRGTLVSTIDETTVAGSSGVRSLRGVLEIRHELRRNLTLTAGLRASDAVYQGVAIDEKGWGAFLRADYKLNRQFAIRASYAYDDLHSTSPGSSYRASTFLLGLRFTP